MGCVFPALFSCAVEFIQHKERFGRRLGLQGLQGLGAGGAL